MLINIGHCVGYKLQIAILNVLKGSGRAFCSGADVVRLYQSLNEGELYFNINNYIFMLISILQVDTTSTLSK